MDLGQVQCTHQYHTNQSNTSAHLAHWAPGLNDKVAQALAEATKETLHRDTKASHEALRNHNNTQKKTLATTVQRKWHSGKAEAMNTIRRTNRNGKPDPAQSRASLRAFYEECGTRAPRITYFTMDLGESCISQEIRSDRRLGQTKTCKE